VLEILAFGERLGDEDDRVVHPERLMHSAAVRRGQALEQPEELGGGSIEPALEEVQVNRAAGGSVFSREAPSGVSAGLPERSVLGIELVTCHGSRADG
jgi:hypothetical protein